MTTESPDGFEAERAAETETPAVAVASYPRRMLDTFFAPGRLADTLRDHPVWVAALLTAVVLAAVQMALIPTDVWAAWMREMALQRGTKVPEGTVALSLTRYFAMGGAVLGVPIFVALASGVLAILFAFILGDEGRYSQYFAVLAHAQIIPTFFGLLIVPLRIAEKNPQATLSLGTFFYFLPQGYLHRVFNMLDLTQAWAWLVVAAGVHAIDSRRSFKSAATLLIVLYVCLALVLGIFVHTV